MTLSVIIPTYNRADLLMQALKSVQKQTHPVDEVIVVDDGSTDGTRDRVLSEFPDVQLFSQPQSGVSSARNAGIRQARGEWVAFLDSDDLWKPKKIARQLAALEKTRGYRLCYTNEEWRKNGAWKNQRKIHQKYSGWIYPRCLPLCIISPSSALVHKSLLDEIGGFDESLPACEDYDLWLRITCRFPVLFLDERLIVKQAGAWEQLSKQHSLDKYRILALQKMLALPDLAGENRELTTIELRKKCQIYASGCRKYGRNSEAIWAERLAESLAREGKDSRFV